jgi:enoyl-CoA hydratase/carnithine racemase
MMTITRIPQPVIARVHGIATAAGCQLVASCDLAVASTEARFATSGINFGLYCATPGVALSRTITRKRAMEMLMTGEFIDAATALEWGLINRVAPPDKLDDAVQELAQILVGKPPAVLAAGKKFFYRQIEMELAPAYKLATQVITENMLGADALEGVGAFIEKRAPRWRTS